MGDRLGIPGAVSLLPLSNERGSVWVNSVDVVSKLLTENNVAVENGRTARETSLFGIRARRHFISSLASSSPQAYGHTTLVNARSRLISEAKQRRAWLVLGWETAWEYQVL